MAQDLRTKHRLVQTQLTVELLDGGRLGGDVDDRVDAFGVLRDLERETTLAPDIDLVDIAAVLADDIQERIQRRGDSALVQAWGRG